MHYSQSLTSIFNFVLFFILVQASSLFAQEQISKLKDDRPANPISFKHSGLKKFIIEHQINGDLNIYKVNVNQIALVHRITHLENFLIQPTPKSSLFIVLSDSVDFYILNIETGELKSINLPGTNKINGFSMVQDDFCIVSALDLSNVSQNYLVKYSTMDSYRIPEEYAVFQANNNYVLLSNDSHNPGLSVLCVGQNEIKTLPDLIVHAHYMLLDDERMVFNLNNQIFQYYFDGDEQSFLYEMNSEYEQFRFHQMNDGHTVFSYKPKDASDFSLTVLTPDRHKYTLDLEVLPDHIHEEIVFDQLVYQVNNKLMIYALPSSKKNEFKIPRFLEKRFDIAYQRYLLFSDSSRLNVYDMVEEKLNIMEGTEMRIDNILLGVGDYIGFGRNLLISASGHSSLNSRLFELSLFPLQASAQQIIPQLNYSIPANYKLIKVANDIILTGTDIFLQEHRFVRKLNQKPVIQTRSGGHTMIQNVVHWAEEFDEYIHIFRLKNRQSEKIYSISKRDWNNTFQLIDFTIFGNQLIYVAGDQFNGRMYSQQAAFGQAQDIGGIFYFLENPTFVNEGRYLYYFNDEYHVRVIKEDLSHSALPLDISFLNTNSWHKFPDGLFFMGLNGFFRLDGLEVIKYANYFSTDSYLQNEKAKIILSWRFPHKMELFDGRDFVDLPLTPNSSALVMALQDDKFAFISNYRGFMELGYLYDIQKSTLYPLDPYFNGYVLVNSFYFKNKLYVVAINDNSLSFQNEIFEISETGLFKQKIFEFPASCIFGCATIEMAGDHCLIYTDTHIYLLDSEINFTKIENLSGDWKRDNATHDGDYFYLFANGSMYNRQLYRIKYSNTEEEEEKERTEPIETQLRVFPNPSRDYINLADDQDFTSQSCVEVLNENGTQVLKTCIFSGTLNVTNLNPGVYFLRIITDQKVKTSKFVKI
jgi:hypothetical protein